MQNFKTEIKTESEFEVLYHQFLTKYFVRLSSNITEVSSLQRYFIDNFNNLTQEKLTGSI